MAIMSGFTRQPYPTPAQVRDVNPSPKAVAVINASIEQSVQEFPPANNSGAFFAQVARGPILPPYGTKDRDSVLRLMYRNEYNNLAQATVAGLSKKVITVPWIIDGDKRNLLYIPDVNGRMRSIEAVDHYTNILNNAQFGAGWGVYLSKWLEDFFTQDFGGITEMIGPGSPTGPISGPVMGIAQLDAGRSYITGNPYFPIMYFSLISGSLHRMHTDRILRLVDSPSPDERYFNIGLCALSRTIAVQNRQQFMNRYIEGLVDDKPKPGILAISNMTDPQWEKATQKYLRQMQNDQPGTFGKTLVLMGMDVEKEIKVNHMPFSDTPEKFDWVKYTELDVHALAAGFNVDVQEIWELTGRQGMGGTGQSQVLHQKSEAKMQGFLLQSIERLFNGQMLNRSKVTLQFKYNDPVQQENEATIDGQLATTAVNLVGTGQITGSEFRAYLKNNSERFSRALTNDMGDVQGTDNSEGTDVQISEPVDHDVKEPVLPSNSAGASSDQPLMPRQQSKVPSPVVSRQPQPRKGRNRVAGVGHSGGVHQKGIQTDGQRRWFFANNPDAAGALSKPDFKGGDSPQDRQRKFEKWAEDSKHPTTAYLWDNHMVDYNSQAEIVVNPDATKLAAMQMVKDVRNAELPRHYLNQLYSEQRGISGSPSQIEARFNQEKAQQAQAIQIAAQHGNVKLTPAQSRYIDSIAKGNYLKEKYSQFPSADNGTLLGTKPSGPRAGSRSEYSRYMRDIHRHEFYNMRTGKAFTLTAATFKQLMAQLLFREIGDNFNRDDFESQMLDLLAESSVKSYADGLRDGGGKPVLDDQDQGYVQDFLIEQIDYIDSLGDDLESGAVDADIVRSRAQMWVNKSLRVMYELGRLKADSEGMYRFDGVDGADSCPQCERFVGQVHSLMDWHSNRFVPRVDTDSFDCGGYRCGHYLIKTDEPESGDW
jgi:hypothetical protein